MDEREDDVWLPEPPVGGRPAGTAPAGPGPEDGPPPTPAAGTTIAHRPSPLRRHPVRSTVAAGGLALVLALGGYGVTHAATSSNAPAATETAAHRVGTATPPRGPGSGSSASFAGGSAAPGGAPGTPGAKAGVPKGGTAGKVTAISGDTITLTTRADKTVRVTVTSSTVFEDGATTSTLGALKQGDLAVVTGSTSSDGTVTAKSVTFGITPGNAPGKNPPSSGA